MIFLFCIFSWHTQLRMFFEYDWSRGKVPPKDVGCGYCGHVGHKFNDCPELKAKQYVDLYPWFIYHDTYTSLTIQTKQETSAAAATTFREKQELATTTGSHSSCTTTKPTMAAATCVSTATTTTVRC